MPSEDVAQLVTRAQTGSYEAFDVLVRRFQDMAVGYAFHVIGDFHLAEDAAQEAFIGAWTDLPRLRDQAAFPGWFRRLVFMRCSRQTRALKRGLVVAADLDLLADPTPGADDALDVQDHRQQLYRAMAVLPDQERLVTVLFYIGRHTHGEIGDFLGLSPDTVNNRLRAARGRLQKEIIHMAKDEFGNHAPSRDDAFGERIARLSRPSMMNTDHYVENVVPVDGHDAWALFCAAAAGDLARVRALLDRDPDLVNAQYWYQFPIHMAVREGHADVVQVLLEAGADPGQSRYTYNSWDKLLAVAQERRHRAVKMLLEMAMTVRFGYDARFEVLADAIRHRDAERADALLVEAPELIHAADALGNSALHWAALTRNLELIDRFQEAGADIDARRADGRTPVLVAVDGDYWYNKVRDTEGWPDAWEVARHLLARGACLDLSVASMMGNVDAVLRILADDPSATRCLTPDRTSPLYRATSFGRTDVVRLLLDRGADPSQPEDLAPKGRAVQAAAGRNDLEIATMLLKAGADPDASIDSSGDGHYIVEFCHPQDCKPMQELLLSYGATPSLPASDEEMVAALCAAETLSEHLITKVFTSDNTALHDLFFRHHASRVPSLVPGDIWGGELPSPQLLARLLDHGLDVSRPNWIGRTFLHVAAEKGTPEIADALLEAGADLEAVELEYGGTPLATGVRVGRADMVDYLLKKGADVDGPAQSPWATAHAWAARSDSRELQRLVRS